MRALAAHLIIGTDNEGEPITRDLNASIQVHYEARRATYHPFAGLNPIGMSGKSLARRSLHRAKNAIRRHFGIESRRLLIWREEQR